MFVTGRVLHLVGQRAWAALAAVLVVGMIVGVALFANRPQAASASEVLGQLQTEAIGFAASEAPACGGAAPGKIGESTGGIVGVQVGPPSTSGPVTAANANELSDRLAAALGVSGDRVRAAMLATVRADLPTSLPLLFRRAAARFVTLTPLSVGNEKHDLFDFDLLVIVEQVQPST